MTSLTHTAMPLLDFRGRQFLNNKTQLLNIVDGFEDSFDDRREFSKTRDYILNFFDILENDAHFKSYILSQARGK